MTDVIPAENFEKFWELAAGIADWQNLPAATALLTIRWIGLATFAPGFSIQTIGFKLRFMLAIMLAGLMAPGSGNIIFSKCTGWPDWAMIATGEFIMG
mgnify:CR=1 FL=1